MNTYSTYSDFQLWPVAQVQPEITIGIGRENGHLLYRIARSIDRERKNFNPGPHQGENLKKSTTSAIGPK